MIFIFGGAFQGKKAYAQKVYGGHIFTCMGSEIDWNADIISDVEEYVKSLLQQGKNPTQKLIEQKAQWAKKIIICNDISQGIVPIDKFERAWREATGRAMIYLAEEAEEVVRIFCGLPHKLK